MLSDTKVHRAVRRSLSLGAVAVAVIALPACGSSESGGDSTGASAASTGAKSAIPDGPIVIGSAIAQTGVMAPYDGGPATGLQVAVDDINAKGGVDGHPLKLIYADTQSDPAKGGGAALDVIEQGADVVVVTCDFDFGSSAAQAAISKGKVAMSTCGASTRFNPDVLGPLLFTQGASTIWEGEVMARWAYEVKDFRKAFLLQETTLAYNEDLCKGMKDAFPEQSGASIVGEESFKGADAKITSQISAIQSAKPDFIWLCSATPAGPSAIKQLRAAGVDVPILSGAGMDGSYWLDAVPNLSDFYYSTYGSIYGDDPRPEVNRFFQAEKEKTGKDPVTSFDMTGYAVGETIKAGVEKAGSLDGQQLAKAIETFTDQPLLTGPTTFNQATHLPTGRPMAIIQVQDGKPSFLQMYPPRQG